MSTAPTIALPQNLRVSDLIAKSAHVTLKDTLRVMAALDAVAFLYDAGPTEIVEACAYDSTRPTPEHVAACEQAYFNLRDKNNVATLDIAPCLQRIKSLM